MELIAEVLGSYGQDVLWDNRVAIWPGFIRESKSKRDLIASRLIPIIDDQKVLLPDTVLDPYVQELMYASGFTMPKLAVYYRTEEERLDRMRDIAKVYPAAIQIPVPYDHLNPSLYAVDRELILFLNNKNNLPIVVGRKLTPHRLHFPRKNTSFQKDAVPSWPIVIKGGLSRPSMGGCEVYICHSTEDYNNIMENIPEDATIITEPYIENKINTCVQFVISATQVIFLGSAEQIIEHGTRHSGNVIRATSKLDPTLIDSLTNACIRAQSLGYRGVVGFDVLIEDDGTPHVIDANFRINGSTVALLLAKKNGPMTSDLTMRTLDIHIDNGSSKARLLSSCKNKDLRVISAVIDSEAQVITATILEPITN